MDADLLAPGLDDDYSVASDTVRVMIVSNDYRQLGQQEETPWLE